MSLPGLASICSCNVCLVLGILWTTILAWHRLALSHYFHTSTKIAQLIMSVGSSRDQEAPKRESASHKSSASQPRAPEYSVKIASHPYGTHAKEYMDLSHRYSRLHVPTDFSKCLSLWTKVVIRRKAPGILCSSASPILNGLL